MLKIDLEALVMNFSKVRSFGCYSSYVLNFVLVVLWGKFAVT